MPYPWLCLWDRTLDIPKAQLLPGDQFKGWVNLLMIANRFGSSGQLPEFPEIAFGLRTDIDTAKQLVDSLVKAHLIDRHGNTFTMHDWITWQARQRTNAERSAAYRAQKKALGERSASAQTSADRARARVRVTEENRREEREHAPATVISHDETNPEDPEVANLAAATESRWPAQNADVFVGDLCRTFDYRLVSQILNQAYDKDPQTLPRAWIRKGCQNESAKGWTPPAPGKNGHQIQADIDAEISRLEAKYGNTKTDQ